MKMTPPSDATFCYICNDKRRTADVNAGTTPAGPQGDSETLKQTLMRALSHGHVEDLAEDEVNKEESRLSRGVCVVVLNSDCDGGLEAVSDRVLDDQIMICRRCAGLLKDFEHHEQTAATIAEKLRKFLIRHLDEEEEEAATPVSKPETSIKKIAARNRDERKGILEAYKAFRKSGMTDIKKRGRKRKNHPRSQVLVKEEKEDENDDTSLEQDQKNTEEEETQQEGITSRHSKRIQMRREDGLVIQWGDALYGKEYNGKSVDDDLSDYSSSILPKSRTYARRGRGRKITRIVKSTSTGKAEGETGLKIQCPFCLKNYIPMSSRLHGCMSYKNKLRCLTCNIFFTSYLRLERHLEVIHLKHNQHACPEEYCDFTCIAEPTLIVHKHFHVLESLSIGDGEEVAFVEKEETPEKGERNKKMLGKDNEHRAVMSPKIADRVSFLLDEKSFLSDGHPLNITTDRIPKDNQDDYKVLRFQGNEKSLESPTSLSSRLDTNSSIKSNGSKFKLQCSICDCTFTSNTSYNDHMWDVHQVVVSSRVAGGDRSETLQRIVALHGSIKKNSKLASKV